MSYYCILHSVTLGPDRCKVRVHCMRWYFNIQHRIILRTHWDHFQSTLSGNRTRWAKTYSFPNHNPVVYVSQHKTESWHIWSCRKYILPTFHLVIGFRFDIVSNYNKYCIYWILAIFRPPDLFHSCRCIEGFGLVDPWWWHGSWYRQYNWLINWLNDFTGFNFCVFQETEGTWTADLSISKTIPTEPFICLCISL